MNDILFGFLIFFALDRTVRLLSTAVIEPWAQKNYPARVDECKIASELMCLLVALVVVIRIRK
jgi:hypothetical protein